MRALRYFILSFGVVLMCLQNASVLIDYHLHREFYEKHCINKQKPALDCHGKCQIKKEAEQESVPLTIIKLAFESHLYPSEAPRVPMPFTYSCEEVESPYMHYLQNVKKGFPSRVLRPPSV